MSRLSLSGVLAVAVAVFGVGRTSDSTTPPTTPTPVAVTETFTGVLNVNGAVTFPFTVSQAGSANGLLKAMQPDIVVIVNPGGSGAFTPNETVYQGPAADAATWSGTVHAWLPGANTLAIRGVTGAFTAESVIVGGSSGARWTGKSIDTTTIGIALGEWSGTTCAVKLANDLSSVGSQVSGVVQGQGSLCARVYDVGKIVTPVTFTIEVTHF
jgi:hypothetical protein